MLKLRVVHVPAKFEDESVGQSYFNIMVDELKHSGNYASGFCLINPHKQNIDKTSIFWWGVLLTHTADDLSGILSHCNDPSPPVGNCPQCFQDQISHLGDSELDMDNTQYRQDNKSSSFTLSAIVTGKDGLDDHEIAPEQERVFSDVLF